MSMRLSRFEPPDLKPLIDRAEPLIARVQPYAARAREGLAQLDAQIDPYVERMRPYAERMRPYADRIGAEVRKHPKLAGGLDAIAATWARLVDAFCGVIEPTLARYFPDTRLVATIAASGEIALRRVASGEVTEVGPLATLDTAGKAELEAFRWSAVELRLRPDQVLQRTLSLPGASREFLAPIIDHRLERLTPWRPDKVLYGYRILDADESAGALQVALVATSKDIVAGPLQTLGEAGLVPTAIGAEDEAVTVPLAINLFKGGDSKTGASDSRAFVSRVALASLGVLFVLYLVTASIASHAGADEDAANAKLTKARRVLRNAALGNLGGRERALIEAKQPDKAVVVLIDKLAAAIPADTYLKELAVTPDKVRLVGTSSNAPALVGELESIGLVNVRFSSAITRERDQKDNFEITADRAAASGPTP